MHIMKKKILSFLPLLLLVLCFVQISCDDDDSYADKEKRERRAISSFLQRGATVISSEATADTVLYVAPINVISEADFAAHDSTTDVSRNEYVLLGTSGVYMQIVRKGMGSKLKNGETAKIVCRYIEYNIMGDSLQTTNRNLYYIAVPDEMTVQNTLGTLTGSFLSGVMKNYYGTTNVPEGWLVPLHYVNLARPAADENATAKVRIIVPHSSGTTTASTGVYACFYEITYGRGI